MGPFPPVFDVIDEAGAHTVLGSNRVRINALGQLGTNGKHFAFIQFGVGICRATLRSPRPCLLARPTLRIHIVRILSLRARKQVGRIDAFPVVAPMQDTGLVVGDVAVCKEVGNAVGCFGPPVADTDLAVPAKADTRRPLPALIRAGLADLLPKQIDLLWGNINTHRVLLTLGATPGVVTATPRLSVLSEQLYQIGRAI